MIGSDQPEREDPRGERADEHSAHLRDRRLHERGRDVPRRALGESRAHSGSRTGEKRSYRYACSLFSCFSFFLLFFVFVDKSFHTTAIMYKVMFSFGVLDLYFRSVRVYSLFLLYEVFLLF